MMKFTAQFAQFAPTASFVERNELHAGDVADQSCFEFSDNPGDLRFRPVALQGADQRHDMTDIAERRKPQDAHGLGRRDHFIVVSLLDCAD